MLNAKVIEKKPPANSRQAHFGRQSAPPSVTAAVKGGAAKAEKKTERTVRTVKSVFAHFPIATCCRPICSGRKCRRASYGLYVIFYGWVYGGRGSENFNLNSSPSHCVAASRSNLEKSFGMAGCKNGAEKSN